MPAVTEFRAIVRSRRAEPMPEHTILCVDDEAIVLESLRLELTMSGALDTATIQTADSAETALELIDELIGSGDEVAVIISDQRMPGMNGDALLERAHAVSPQTLNILLTGFADIDAIANAVNNASLYRYISKPWAPHDLVLTVREAYFKFIQNKIIEEKNRKIESLTMAMVSALESANYFNDEDTGLHIRRIALYSDLIARKAGLDDELVRRIRLYSSLHDIGKVGVRRDVLLKPGRLDPGEFDEARQHVMIGFRILDNEEIDQTARNIVRFHHERWDGSGYLEGLKGTEIPVEARIVAIADVFDALVSERVYKPACSLEQSIETMRSGRGSHFDPLLLDIFLDSIAEVSEISLSQK